MARMRRSSEQTLEYKIEQAEGKLICTDSIAPDIENLDSAIQAGMNATLNGNSSYMHG